MKKLLLFVIALILVATPSLAKVTIGTALGYPTLSLAMGKDLVGSLGARNSNFGGTATALLVKVDYNLEKVGDVQPALGIYYMTNGAAAAITNIGISYGLMANVAQNLNFGLDFVLVNQTSFAGATTTDILAVAGGTGVAVKASYVIQ